MCTVIVCWIIMYTVIVLNVTAQRIQLTKQEQITKTHITKIKKYIYEITSFNLKAKASSTEEEPIQIDVSWGKNH